MLMRLSRLSAGLAAAAAGLMLLGPLELRSLGADLALALASAAFLLWRLSAALERRLAEPIDAALPALQLGEAALADVHAALARAAAAAPSFEVALLDAGAALRGELGARQVRIYRVNAGEQPPSVQELIGDRPPLRAPARALSAAGSALLARAVFETRPCLDLPRAAVFPVLCEGVTVALLELRHLELAVDEAPLTKLLEAAADALSARAEPSSRGQATRPDPTAAGTRVGLWMTNVVGTRSC